MHEGRFAYTGFFVNYTTCSPFNTGNLIVRFCIQVSNIISGEQRESCTFLKTFFKLSLLNRIVF